MKDFLSIISDNDFEDFEQYVESFPSGAIIGKANDPFCCPIAYWWTAKYGVPVWVSFLKHGLDDISSSSVYEFNPYWVRCLVTETDIQCVEEVTKECMQEFILPRVKWLVERRER